MFLPDVNVLVYAHRVDAERHEENARWLTERATGTQPFAISELVISGFLRVVTNRRIFKLPSTMEIALEFVDQITARPTCRLVRPGPRHFGIFADLCRKHALAGGLVADAYHAALAIELGCTWVTNDTDFARFEGLTWRTP
jgi:toxin-antitoxin system PIN domain toxin